MNVLGSVLCLTLLLACLAHGYFDTEQQSYIAEIEDLIKPPSLNHDLPKEKPTPLEPIGKSQPLKTKNEPVTKKYNQRPQSLDDYKKRQPEHHSSSDFQRPRSREDYQKQQPEHHSSSDFQRPPSWNDYKKQRPEHHSSSDFPMHKKSPWTDTKTIPHPRSDLKEKPSQKHNKFQNLVSRLGDRDMHVKPEKPKPKYKPRRRYEERPPAKPVRKPERYYDEFDAIDEYRDKNGVLVSIPIDIIRYFSRFYEPRVPKSKRLPPRKKHVERRPPKTINPARKINFDYSTNIDTEGRVSANFQDKGVKYAAGSYQDQLYSQWFVVTKEGLEYDGDPKELKTIFELANKQNLPSTSDVIPDKLFNSMNTMSTIQHEGNSNTAPPDSREMVTNTDQYPFSVIGRFDVGCTGTLIGPNHVLTAGHCVYDYDKGLWYSHLDFHRGKDCDPDEGKPYKWELAITVKGWKNYGYPSYDYAIVMVSKASPRWMTFGWSNFLHMADVQVVGYPNDKEDKCMWDTSCNIGQEWNDLLGYKCDTSSGMSGGPVYRYERDNNKAIVYCVHAYGADDYNACAQITRPRFTQFINWISHYVPCSTKG